MLVVRCTKRLLKLSRRTAAPDVPEPTGLLSEWYANAVSLAQRGHHAVLYVNADTRLCVVAPGRTLGTTLPLFADRLTALLHRLGVPSEIVERERPHWEQTALAPTRDRSVIGSMVDFAMTLRIASEWAAPGETLDFAAIEDRMARTPILPLHSSPDRMVFERLGAPGEPRGRRRW